MDAAQIAEQYAKQEQANLMEEMRWRRKLDGYRVVFEKFDRILSGRLIDVAISDHAPPFGNDPLGWTDGETIWLNGPRLANDLKALQGKDITSQVIALKGINLHELSHVLRSPRMSDEICRLVTDRVNSTCDNRWWHALNILEDQRAETLHAAQYRPSIKYFEAIALRWLVANQQALAQSHCLVHGRKFLPKKVRRASADAFEAKYGKALRDEVSDIIDRYLPLIFPGDTMPAFKLVSRMRDVLEKMEGKGPITIVLVISGHPNALPQNRRGGSGTAGMRKGRALVKDQKKGQEALEKMLEDDEAEEGDGEGVSLSDEAQEGVVDEEKTDGEQGVAGGGEADLAEPAQAQQQSAEASSGEEPGDGCSTGPSPENPWDKDIDEALRKASEAIEAALDKAMDNEDLKADVHDTIQAIKLAQGGGDADPMGGKANYNLRDPQPETPGVIKRLTHILADLKHDLEPTWHRRETYGRLNMRRAMLHQPHELDIFDRWDEGQEDEGGVEVVTLIDQSSSMNWRIAEASEALWTLKRAFDDLHIRTTVIGYNDDHRILMYGDEVVEKNQMRLYGSSGSTDPTSALAEAYGVLAASNEPNKVLITITDGQWMHNDAQALGAVKAIHAIGGTSLLLGLDNAKERYGVHGHEYGQDMTSITDLPGIVTTLVAGILSKVVSRT